MDASPSENGAEEKQKKWSNGDRYVGGWLDGLPHGDGKYTWSNGSTYDGTWQRGLRHGVGRYMFASGAVYQGEWRDGHMHGVGTMEGAPEDMYIRSPCGTVLSSPPSSPNRQPSTPGSKIIMVRYQGGWQRGLKHGLGKQHYSNGDVYEGLWRGGVPNGPGRYLFSNGGEFDGQWASGKMHGLGTFVWASGERYDGSWKSGHPEGLGVLVLPDGSVFDSQWLAGLRHGVCLYKPPPVPLYIKSTRKSTDYTFMSGVNTATSPKVPIKPIVQEIKPSLMSSVKRGSWLDVISPNRTSDTGVNGSFRGGSLMPYARMPSTVNDTVPTHTVSAGGAPPNRASSGGVGPHAGPVHGGPVPLPSPLSLSRGSAGGGVTSSSGGFLMDVSQSGSHSHTYLREYEYGQLLNEWQLGRDEIESVLPSLSTSKGTMYLSPRARRQSSSVSTKTDKLMGEFLVKGHRSYDVMLNLQLGIRYSVMRANQEETIRELSPGDYKLKVRQFFPRRGSNLTPVHCTEDFTWRDYAPTVFRKLRDLFDVDAGTYMDSLCSESAVRLLNSPGKSGSVFFLSHDDRFFIKTVKKSEAKLLFTHLPTYYRHTQCHPHTLLTKFYGLHCIKTESGKKMYVVVMQNLFPDPLLVQVHTKYDLKGSRLGRTIGTQPLEDLDDPHVILKDLDLNMTFRLDPVWLERLEFQLRADCALLQSCQVMDYSLMLGVTYRSRATGILGQETQGNPTTTATAATANSSTHKRPNNFSEAEPEARYQTEYPRLCDKVAKSRLPEEAKRCMLQLARARYADGPGLRAAQRRSQECDPSIRGTCPPLGDAAGPADTSTAEQLALQLGLSHTQLGVNMPAMAISTDRTDGRKPEEVVLSFGIIDFLQDYNTSKRLEHNIKSIMHDAYSISVTNPTTYAQRFQSFLRSVFT